MKPLPTPNQVLSEFCEVEEVSREEAGPSNAVEVNREEAGPSNANSEFCEVEEVDQEQPAPSNAITQNNDISECHESDVDFDMDLDISSILVKEQMSAPLITTLKTRLPTYQTYHHKKHGNIFMKINKTLKAKTRKQRKSRDRSKYRDAH